MPDQHPASPDTLTALAAAGARGDQDALTRLVRATQQDVTRFLTRLCAPADVADLTQETYLRAIRALPSFAGRASVRTWLFAIARRVAADQVRTAMCRPRLVALPADQDAVLPGARFSGPRERHRFDEQHALTDLLQRLEPQRREAFQLTQLAGLSYAEAAAACGCPVGTIRSRVARAREDLIAALAVDDKAHTAVG
ncbi:sigma-70 family RNA polymerase sigma factor [Actinoplanes sp. NPDC051859]|uniref:sigma-70 family RNA polymerase sigma factor n=1 Tax=Actinoplanes sp. NPDC051859 TaxID=3363909 RepID=UPI00379F49D1